MNLSLFSINKKTNKQKNKYYICVYVYVYDLFKMTSYTLGQKVIAPTKPDRGVFPLDHKGRYAKNK